MRTVFMGSPAEVIPVIAALTKAPYCQLVGVISQPDRPAGRKRVMTPPPVAQYAQEHDLKLWQPEKASCPEFIAELQTQNIDVMITAAYGQILSTDFINVPRRAVINIHPSLLPKYRGATPVQSTLLNAEKTTGVTILFTVKALDAGAIISQTETTIAPHETSAELMPRLFELSTTLLPEVFKKLSTDSFSGQAQDEHAVTHCQKIAKQDGLIHWEHETALTVTSKYRAYQPWPGVFTYYKGKKAQLFDVQVAAKNLQAATTGAFELADKRLVIQCSDSSISVGAIKLEGKKKVAAFDFFNGIRDTAAQQFSDKSAS